MNDDMMKRSAVCVCVCVCVVRVYPSIASQEAIIDFSPLRVLIIIFIHTRRRLSSSQFISSQLGSILK